MNQSYFRDIRRHSIFKSYTMTAGHDNIDTIWLLQETWQIMK